MPSIILYFPSSHFQSDIQDQSQFHNFNFLSETSNTFYPSLILRSRYGKQKRTSTSSHYHTHPPISVSTLSTFSLVTTNNKVQALLWKWSPVHLCLDLLILPFPALSMFFYGSLSVAYKHSSHSIFKKSLSWSQIPFQLYCFLLFLYSKTPQKNYHPTIYLHSSYAFLVPFYTRSACLRRLTQLLFERSPVASNHQIQGQFSALTLIDLSVASNIVDLSPFWCTFYICLPGYHWNRDFFLLL